MRRTIIAVAAATALGMAAMTTGAMARGGSGGHGGGGGGHFAGGGGHYGGGYAKGYGRGYGGYGRYGGFYGGLGLLGVGAGLAGLYGYAGSPYYGDSYYADDSYNGNPYYGTPNYGTTYYASPYYSAPFYGSPYYGAGPITVGNQSGWQHVGSCRARRFAVTVKLSVYFCRAPFQDRGVAPCQMALLDAQPESRRFTSAILGIAVIASSRPPSGSELDPIARSSYGLA
jgi:hypothetical protein